MWIIHQEYNQYPNKKMFCTPKFFVTKLQCDGTLSRFFGLVAFLEECLRRSFENFSVHYASLSYFLNFRYRWDSILKYTIFIYMNDQNISRFYWC